VVTVELPAQFPDPATEERKRKKRERYNRWKTKNPESYKAAKLKAKLRYSKERSTETRRKWQERNPEKYRAANAKALQRAKTLYKTDISFKEGRKAYARAYQKTAKAKKLRKARDRTDKYKEIARLYRARKRNSLRDRWLRKKYGISLAIYESMLSAQGGACAICGVVEDIKTRWGTARNLKVDHCHVNGAVRGILCQGCNAGLGHFRDSPDIMQKAIAYLLRARVGAA
jgi:hypothetical protein